MKTKIVSILLIFTLIFSLTGCRDDGAGNIEKVSYDPEAEVAKYDLPEIPEADKNFKIQMGYNDCDHMVGAIIGEQAGIYKALGLDVTVTKTKNSNIAQAMTTGEMHVGYMGVEGALRSRNEGAPIIMAAANHLGGSRYLVASNDIKEPKDLLGKKVSISQDPENDPEWIKWAKKLDLPIEKENYEIIEMSQKDGPMALKSGQISAFSCCDPFASQAEYQKLGKVLAVGWGGHVEEDSENGWGMCCIYGMNENFKNEHPELAKRLLVGHALSLKYLYDHPYNAAMMFADGFGTVPEVGLMTVYMKTIAEGRTITWEFTKQNLDNYIAQYTKYNIDEKYIPNTDKIDEFLNFNLIKESGVEDFEKFLEDDKINEKFPIGISFEDWLKKAKEIDGIDNEVGNDIKIPEVYNE
ncbi:ABC transporter substrate-binding subunit SaoX [Lagierella sp.]|uniref:ABC transporter substrate-binding subunit SaoX n=1 Tax=Lagierella sp. TaxID=2849657 RepID=UPI0026323371|nr:ABC transporter substrate-binding subunit SaoX [Lagierella sp.]